MEGDAANNMAGEEKPKAEGSAMHINLKVKSQVSSHLLRRWSVCTWSLARM